MKKMIVGGLAVAAALVSTTVVAAETASADPGQNCKTEWNTMYNVPVGVRTTCFNPDGSYHVCTSIGTDGKGPGHAGTIRLPSDGRTAHIQPARCRECRLRRRQPSDSHDLCCTSYRGSSRRRGVTSRCPCGPTAICNDGTRSNSLDRPVWQAAGAERMRLPLLRRGPREDELMFKVMAGVVALAAAGSVAWGATQGVSVGEIIHGVEHLTVAKDEHGNWSIRIDDPGDEVGFVKACTRRPSTAIRLRLTCCSWATRPAGGLRNGSGPNDIINWLDQKPQPVGVPPS